MRHGFFRVLAVVLLLGHALPPGVWAAPSDKGGDISSWICAPTGALSPDAEAASAEFLKILESREHAPLDSTAHCPLCVLVMSATLPVPVAARSAGYAHLKSVSRPYDAQACSSHHAAPLGQRAPPVFN